MILREQQHLSQKYVFYWLWLSVYLRRTLPFELHEGKRKNAVRRLVVRAFWFGVCCAEGMRVCGAKLNSLIFRYCCCWWCFARRAHTRIDMNSIPLDVSFANCTCSAFLRTFDEEQNEKGTAFFRVCFLVVAVVCSLYHLMPVVHAIGECLHASWHFWP